MDSAQDLFNPAPTPQEFQAPMADKFYVGADGQRAMLSSEEGVQVRFFEDSYKLEEASARAGIPMYETRVFCEIKCKFDPKNVHVHMVRKQGEDEWKVRFAKEWDLYCKAREYATKGFPVAKWEEISPHQAASLDGIGIFTLEQLVVAEDAILAKLFEKPKKIKEAALAQLNYKNKVAEITEVTKKLVETNGKLETANEIIERLELEKRSLTTALNAVKGKQRLATMDKEAKQFLASAKQEKQAEPVEPQAQEPAKPASEGIIISGE